MPAFMTHWHPIPCMGRGMALLALLIMLALPLPAQADAGIPDDHAPWTREQRAQLMDTARQTWKFFDAAVDPHTHLPVDSIGLYGAPGGTYTTPTNIGVYLWSVVAALDLGIISRPDALHRAAATLATVAHLKKWQGFLLSLYDTTTGNWISSGPGGGTSAHPLTGQFISTIDNAWYATGLLLVRQVFPRLRQRATTLFRAMNFGQLYDASGRPSTNLNYGQMCGGRIVGGNPCPFHCSLCETNTVQRGVG